MVIVRFDYVERHVECLRYIVELHKCKDFSSLICLFLNSIYSGRETLKRT